MIQINKVAIIGGFITVMALSAAVAATVQGRSPSVIITVGQTIEVPVSSDIPIAGDLAASGNLNPGDVTFIPGPGCHLSSHGCTLLIKVASNSRDYTQVPVMVSDKAGTYGTTFNLSVVQRGETTKDNSNLAKIILTPSKQSTPIMSKVVAPPTVTVAIPSPKPTTTLTAGNLSATILPHGTSSTFYTSSSNGPVYQMIQVTNNGSSITLDTPAVSGTDAASFSIDTTSSDYAGSPTFCNNAPTLANGDSCEIIIRSTSGDPASAPATATLTISDGVSGDTLTFDLTDTTYVYAGGGFNALGNASVSGGDLLVACTAGTCINALQGNTGNNYASTNFSVGQWINSLSVTATGNLIVGGVFGAIGGATSGATTGTAALLAQCTPGSVNGNACINQINQTGSLTNAYAFNNAYIDAITPPISGTGFMYLGGDFTNIRNASTPGGRILAKCAYSGAVANQACTVYLTAATTKYANSAISAVDYLNSKVNVGGLFTQIAGYPSSVPSTGTTFASCSISSCSQGMSSNPDNSILGMTDDGTQLYIGGVFKQAGGYIDSSGGYPLLSCTPATITNCNNALAGSDDANGYIEGLTYSGGNLYVGGQFTTIGGAIPVSSGNMLAVCTPLGSCSNFVTDTNPYASGGDWGGNISAIAVGNQTSITAN